MMESLQKHVPQTIMLCIGVLAICGVFQQACKVEGTEQQVGVPFSIPEGDYDPDGDIGGTSVQDWAEAPWHNGVQLLITQGYTGDSHNALDAAGYHAVDFDDGCKEPGTTEFVCPYPTCRVIHTCRSSTNIYGTNICLVNEADGRWQFLAHLNMIHPEAGNNALVSRGSTVGWMGNTGNVQGKPGCAGDGTHLHLEISDGSSQPGRISTPFPFTPQEYGLYIRSTVSSDVNLPNIAIDSPTSSASYTTLASSMTLGGTYQYASAVSWSSSTGSNSNCSLSGSRFTCSYVPLQPGSQTITTTASNAAGEDSDALSISYTPPASETCNGLDDDGNGTVDDPCWTYLYRFRSTLGGDHAYVYYHESIYPADDFQIQNSGNPVFRVYNQAVAGTTKLIQFSRVSNRDYILVLEGSSEDGSLSAESPSSFTRYDNGWWVLAETATNYPNYQNVPIPCRRYRNVGGDPIHLFSHNPSECSMSGWQSEQARFRIWAP